MHEGREERRAGRTLALIALGLPLTVALALLLVPTGRVMVPPVWTVGLAAVGLAALATAVGGGGRRWYDLPAAALLGLAAGHLLFAPGMPRGHDLVPHLWGTWGFLMALEAGDPFPQWLHHVGLGLPLTLFYGPTSFYLMAPLHLLGLKPYVVWKAGFLLHGMLASLAMYWVARRWTEDRRAALVAAVAYAFAPYRLLDANYRVALAESAAFIVLPLYFFSVLEVARHGGRRRYAAAALATGLLVSTHPLTTLMAVVGAGIWITVEFSPLPALGGRVQTWLEKVGTLAVATLLGLALAGFFVLPLLAEASFTTVDRAIHRAGMPKIASEGLYPAQLVERRVWSELRNSVPAGLPGDGTEREMPFYFGLALLALLPLAAGAGRLPGESGEVRARMPPGLTWATAAALALTLRPLDRVLGWLPLLPTLQFSWRFLAIASFGAAAGAGFATARLLAAWRGRWVAALPGLVAALLVLDAFPFTGAADWLPAYEGFVHVHRPDPGCGRRWGCWETEPVPPPLPHRVIGAFLPPADCGLDVSNARPGYPEYFTPAVRARLIDPGDGVDNGRWGIGMTARADTPGVTRLDAAPYAQWLAPADTGTEPGEPRSATRGGGLIEVTLDGRPGLVVVLEQYFPGWQVETGSGWREVAPTADGLLQAEVAAGRRTVRFRFSSWRWDRTAGWLVTIATAASFLVPGRGRRGARA